MLEEVSLNLPAKAEDIAELKIGSVVFLNGLVYTAREGVYNKILSQGEALPDGVMEKSNGQF